LIEQTAYGIRRNDKFLVPESGESQVSMVSTPADNRRLGLVFFDVLSLNGNSLLHKSYNARRAILESLIRSIPGETMLAHRTPIELHRRGFTDSLKDLESTFANCISNSEEGLILKAAESRYHDWSLPWVKLKRDYIPGYGDTLDMVLAGASWEKERGRELRGDDTIINCCFI
jgi:DNA ligase 4